MRLVPSPPVSLQPGETDSGAHPAETSRLQHAEEDLLASGDAPADQTLFSSEGTGEESSIRQGDRTVLVIREGQGEEEGEEEGGRGGGEGGGGEEEETKCLSLIHI